MRSRILLTLLLAGTVIVAGFSAGKVDPFSSAKDLPRGALVYIQAADLPKLIGDLKASDIGANYIQSRSFADFQNNHLGRKLTSRWQELNDGAGFPFDLQTIAGFAETRAAMGIYDIGKLEFVFTAPVSDELFNATMLMQKPERFEGEENEDGITIYRVAIDADRGRQKQELSFAQVKGRLIIATAEKLLVRTINNINGKARNDSLSDDPLFRRLRDAVKPNLVTVWVNQAALNSDYYFKRYWLMGDVADLKNYHAGMFDFSIEDDRFVEDRQFIVNDGIATRNISAKQFRTALRHLPEDVPYSRFRAAAPDVIDEAVMAIIDTEKPAKTTVSKRESFSYADDGYDYEYRDYEYLGSKFDTLIDEQPDDEPAPSPADTPDDISPLFLRARAESVLTFTRPELRPAPLFADFRRGAVFRLDTPLAFDKTGFENSLRKTMLGRVTIVSRGIELEWSTKNENGMVWREFDLPMLDRALCYTIRGNELFLANDAGFLSEMLQTNRAESDEKNEGGISEFSAINIPGAEKVYDPIFAKLTSDDLSLDFFTGNIKSLFGSIPRIQTIEYQKGASGDLLHEKIVIRRNQ